MTRPRRTLSLALAALLGVAGVSYLASHAAARAALMAPPAAPVIAVVDLEGVLSGLKEREDKEKAYKAQGEELQTKLKGLKEQLEGEAQTIDNMPAGPAKETAIKAFGEKRLRAEFERQFSQKILNELQAEMIRSLYLKISAACAEAAKRNGYHLVMASDQRIGVPQGDIDTVTRAIALKRMLHVDQGLDITEEIKTLMNNQYAAGAAAGGTAPKR